MPKRVIDTLPNINPSREVLLFHDYVCVEHYPFKSSSLVGHSLAFVLGMLDLAFPLDCKYAFYRYKDYHTTIKEYGRETCIINTKHLLTDYAEDSTFGD